MSIDLNAVGENALNILILVGMKILGAVLIWIIGRKLIGFSTNLISKALDRHHLDQTVVGYIRSTVGVVLTLALVLGLLSFFGVETTTFAALLAAAGIAIGAAWSGLLSNFAAGVFLVVLRPFKVGDTVSAGGVTGTVKEIGLFGTKITAADNVLTVVGNSKILADNILNYSANEFRRVDLVAQLNQSVEPAAAIRLLREGLKKVPNVLATPAPDIEILQFNLAGPVLAVRPYVSNVHYWQVYFDTNRLIQETFQLAGYPVPEQHYAVRTTGGGEAKSAGSGA
jgi:small conductance mechanosensitive channel